MKKRVLWMGLALLLIVPAGCRKSGEPERVYERKYLKVIKEARKEAFYYMVRNFVPGGSIALSIDGELVWSEGMGQASTDLEVPATRFTKYRMGEISQVLTSLGYLRMAEAGLLDPDAEVRVYLPNFPEKQYPLALHHLADHCSGIRPPTNEEKYARGLNGSLEQSINFFSGDTLLFPPGNYQLPTMYNFNLLGRIMEKTAEESFSKVIKKWVTDTLGLKNTVPDDPLITIKGRSDFYDRNLVAQTINAVTLDLRYRLPSDGYLSTAEDLVRLGNALLTSPLLSDPTRQHMFTAPLINNEFNGNFGKGLLYLRNREGRNFYAAKGNIRGSGALLLIFPDEKMVLGWMTNLSDEGEELPGLLITSLFREFLAGDDGKVEAPAQRKDKQGRKDSSEENTDE